MPAEFTFRREGEMIVVTEKWRLDDPALPFIVPDWHPHREAILKELDGAESLATDYPFTEERFIDTFGADKLP